MTREEYKNLSWVDKMDCLRLWPRLFILTYMWLLIETANWFFTLDDPTLAQAGFASAVISAGAAWFGLYVNSGAGAVKVAIPTDSK